MEDHVLKENDLVLVSDEWGDISRGQPHLGLYYRDTRYLSILQMTLNGQQPLMLGSSSEESYIFEAQLANPTLTLEDGTPVLARTISIRRSRFVRKGLHETISLFNHNRFSLPIRLGMSFGADFYDIFEVRGEMRKERGTLNSPRFTDSCLIMSYTGLDDVQRRSEVSFDPAPDEAEIEERWLWSRELVSSVPVADEVVTRVVSSPPYAELTWNLTLDPQVALSISFSVMPIEGDQKSSLRPVDGGLAELRKSYDGWRQQCTVASTDHELLNRALNRSILDLRLLMEETPVGMVPNAGIPWFVAFFGRDTLITSLQTLMVNPQIATSTLRFLARHQGTEVNDWLDEEPGKIIHEMRKGEMAKLGEVAFGSYYGSADATPLFLIVFTETMKWLDDDDLFNELMPAVERALAWIEQYGDLDGDGYVEYRCRSSRGLLNHGWKDSGDSLLDSNGNRVEQPVALVEVQGYVYKAMSELSALLRRKGQLALADRLSQRAATLKENFNRDFWLDDKQFFAQALDAQNRPVEEMTSNPGHCFFCDIMDEDKAALVAQQLVAREMACGWGIRTLSRSSPHFNPMSYHNGSIWPHDNSLIVAGLKRQGHVEEALEVITQLADASSFFPYGRLPELFCGFARETESRSAPIPYPSSCSPQSWAAGTPFLLIQAMLGIEVDAAAHQLSLHPTLPPWLRSVSLDNMRIGRGTVGLRFERRNGTFSLEVTENSANIDVIFPRQISSHH